MEIDWVNWFGYLASLVILISLTMVSIIRLRWINFVGCVLFAIFGFMINSLPTALMNVGIAIINLYYLYNIYNTKEKFELLEEDLRSNYLKHFIEVNYEEVSKQITEEELRSQDKALYLLRDNNLAGIVVGERKGREFFIKLDFVIPPYRDYKLGEYLFTENTEYFKKNNITKLIARATEQSHRIYLEKIGFKENENSNQNFYTKNI